LSKSDTYYHHLGVKSIHTFVPQKYAKPGHLGKSTGWSESGFWKALDTHH